MINILLVIDWTLWRFNTDAWSFYLKKKLYIDNVDISFIGRCSVVYGVFQNSAIIFAEALYIW